MELTFKEKQSLAKNVIEDYLVLFSQIYLEWKKKK
jgi:hypothetical protein